MDLSLIILKQLHSSDEVKRADQRIEKSLAVRTIEDA